MDLQKVEKVRDLVWERDKLKSTLEQIDNIYDITISTRNLRASYSITIYLNRPNEEYYKSAKRFIEDLKKEISEKIAVIDKQIEEL